MIRVGRTENNKGERSMKLVDNLKSKEIELPEDKKTIVYVILAVLLGYFGVHNFYAGNSEKAKAQLVAGLIGVCCCCFPFAIVSQVTAWCDLATLIEAGRAK